MCGISVLRVSSWRWLIGNNVSCKHGQCRTLKAVCVCSWCRLVHDHCYRIMKYAADEIMSADQAERAAEFWTGAHPVLVLASSVLTRHFSFCSRTTNEVIPWMVNLSLCNRQCYLPVVHLARGLCVWLLANEADKISSAIKRCQRRACAGFVEPLFGLPKRAKGEASAAAPGRVQAAGKEQRALHRKPSMRLAAMSGAAPLHADLS